MLESNQKKLVEKRHSRKHHNMLCFIPDILPDEHLL